MRKNDYVIHDYDQHRYNWQLPKRLASSLCRSRLRFFSLHLLLELDAFAIASDGPRRRLLIRERVTTAPLFYRMCDSPIYVRDFFDDHPKRSSRDDLEVATIKYNIPHDIKDCRVCRDLLATKINKRTLLAFI